LNLRFQYYSLLNTTNTSLEQGIFYEDQEYYVARVHT